MVLNNGTIAFVMFMFFSLAFMFGAYLQKSNYQDIVNALHTQIEKQNCEENTIPKLRKELLGK